MKYIIATSVVALLSSTPAIAQSTSNGPQMSDETVTMATFIEAAHESDVLASELMDAAVYAHDDGARADMAADMAQDTDMRALRMVGADERDQMEEIGNVADVLVDQDGTIRGVIVGIGGFLGIGEREVVIGLDQLDFARDADDPETLVILAGLDAQMLEEAPEFDRAAFQDRTAMTDTEQDDPGMGLADRDTAGQDAERDDMMAESQPAHEAGEEQWRQAREMFTPPDFEREGFERAEAVGFSVDVLLGADVYDLADENIGNVDDVIVDSQGEMEYVVIDIGGFLGIGAHTVALGFDEVTLLHDGADELRIYVDATEDQLRDMPEYQG